MYSHAPQGSDWLKHISTIMWGSSINTAWTPLTCLPIVSLSPTCQQGKWLRVVMCVSLTLWQTSPLASSPSQRLQFILITILPPPFPVTPCQAMNAVCSDIVSAPIFHAVISPTLCIITLLHASFPPFVVIIPFHPSHSSISVSQYEQRLSCEDKTWH